MKPFGSSSLQNPLKLRAKISKMDNSASLVKIVDQLGQSPFGVVHRRLAPTFNIVMLRVIRRHGTASRNFSAMCRHLPFSADLIPSFRAQHTGTKGKVRLFGDSPIGLADHSASLVEIADQLDDPPFGRFHRRVALSFIIVVFWISGRHSTASRNCSATRRLSFFTADLILSFRAQHTTIKVEDKTFWRFAKWV
uniref:Uncharacterized protein n=1 Tax=Solanum tuberosum TaxID=4113 RepID=M1DLV5_SOLTU